MMVEAEQSVACKRRTRAAVNEALKDGGYPVISRSLGVTSEERAVPLEG